MDNPETVSSPPPDPDQPFQFSLLTLMELIFGVALILSALFWKVDPHSHISEVFAVIAVVLVVYGVFRRRWVLFACVLIFGMILIGSHYGSAYRSNYKSESELITDSYTFLICDRETKKPIPHARVRLRTGDEDKTYSTEGESDDNGRVNIDATFRGKNIGVTDDDYQIDVVSLQISTIEIQAPGYSKYQSNLSGYKNDFESLGKKIFSDSRSGKTEILFELIHE